MSTVITAVYLLLILLTWLVMLSIQCRIGDSWNGKETAFLVVCWPVFCGLVLLVAAERILVKLNNYVSDFGNKELYE